MRKNCLAELRIRAKNEPIRRCCSLNLCRIHNENFVEDSQITEADLNAVFNSLKSGEAPMKMISFLKC